MRGRLTGLVMALAAGTLAPAACGDSRPEPGTDSPSATRERSTTAERPEGGTWDVGSSPLPTRADGFGRVLPTPPPLRVRRLPTVERLPDPESDRFESSIRRIGPRIRARMAGTWSRDCPVPLEELRYVATEAFDDIGWSWGWLVADHHGLHALLRDRPVSLRLDE